ncbi:MAG: hypothetical protein JTT13_05785 [Candidatus Brockarchaeota archaeon]|nr:hypothetical protein [Candidatus Brockarchaeota archaeon]
MVKVNERNTSKQCHGCENKGNRTECFFKCPYSARRGSVKFFYK